MNGTKDWYTSSTVWGGILATFGPILAILLPHFGVSWTPDLQASIVSLLAGIGGVVAIIGRMRATTTISGPPKGN